jgi:hypothetical protein
MSFPHSKEQAASATKTISTEEDIASTLYLIAEEELQTVRVQDGGEKREHFVKLTLRNGNHSIMLPVFQIYTDHILIKHLPYGCDFTN